MSECSYDLCRRVGELLLQFRDQDLPPDDLEFVRDHLHKCPPCVGIFNSYEEVVEVLHRLQPVKMPEGLMDRMKRKIAEGASIEDEEPCDE